MRVISLAGTELTLSRLSFGTASLHHVGSLKTQIKHLHAAYDAGFTHFDTAPLYGFGGAEFALGQAFGAELKHKVSIATKVGIYPPGSGTQSRVEMLSRKVIGKVISSVSKADVDWSLDRARTSLNLSLERLGRDYVDLLLLHEPDCGLLNKDEWLGWLEYEAKNRVKAFGVSGYTSHIAPFINEQTQASCVVQMHDSLERREADILINNGRSMQLTFGYLSNLSNDSSVTDILAEALTRNNTGSIIVSTRNSARLSVLSSICNSVDCGEFLRL